MLPVTILPRRLPFEVPRAWEAADADWYCNTDVCASRSRRSRVQMTERPRQLREAPPDPLDAHAALELEMLYRDRRHDLTRFFARYRASPDDARDLTQEAFLRLSDSQVLRPGRIQHAEAYLRTIARNLLRNRAKAAVRHSDHAHVDIDDQSIAGASEIARLEARDSLNRLEAAMRAMKPKTRRIYMAHRLDGLSYAEIALEFGMSVSGVEKAISRALVVIDRHVVRD
jgi:RNA polymerase sigma factor (sigma-70 family)